jgi:hypothetical protein
MNDYNQYWFRAKRYGWGWGLPSSPAGWTFFLIWLAALILGVTWFRRYHPLAPVAFLALMTALLVLVCYKKGEPPSWRWGDREQ